MRLPALLVLVGLSAPLSAQGVAVATQGQVNAIDKRVTTLEGQMRAVQRQVFPGGDRRFFAPEIVPEPAAPPAAAPASSPLLDLTQRVETLEEQQRQLTGQVEQLQFRLRQLEERETRARTDTEFRLNALEGRGAAAPAPAQPDPAPVAVAPPAVPAPATAPPATAAAAADPLEARYLAAYRLYTAGQHVEAARQLGEFASQNPKHPRASNAQFWAGRSMMALGQHAQAAKAFLDGYQKFPRGERAHNSLLWLGRALTAMNRLDAACQALDELRKAYPDRLTGGFATEAANARSAARCRA